MSSRQLLSATLCLMGALFGFVALNRIRGDQFRGWRLAWTGIILGGLPLLLLIVLCLGWLAARFSSQ
jgi:hypothetical protein